MAFPPPKKKPNFTMGDGPADDVGAAPHSELGPNEEEIDSIMGADPTQPMDKGSEDIFGGGSPLESALADAGFANVTPEQITQIEAILKPVAAPKSPMAGKPTSQIGGATAGGMTGSDIPGL